MASSSDRALDLLRLLGREGSPAWAERCAAQVASWAAREAAAAAAFTDAAEFYVSAGGAAQASVSPFWRDSYEKNKSRNWDLFYRRNKDNFYKDRHYLLDEYPELRPAQGEGQGGWREGQEGRDERAGGRAEGKDADAAGTCTEATAPPGPPAPPPQTTFYLLEAGCGTGASVWPMLEENPSIFAFATDLSKTAIDIMRGTATYDTARCRGFVSDYAAVDAPATLSRELGGRAMDAVLLMYSLSAVAPEHHRRALAGLVAQIKPGGAVLFRDYARGDLAQVRFDKDAKEKRLGDNFYVRCDGTRSFFFTPEGLAALAKECGLEVVEMRYVKRVVENKAMQVQMKRLWLHARFRKVGEVGDVGDVGGGALEGGVEEAAGGTTGGAGGMACCGDGKGDGDEEGKSHTATGGVAGRAGGGAMMSMPSWPEAGSAEEGAAEAAFKAMLPKGVMELGDGVFFTSTDVG